MIPIRIDGPAVEPVTAESLRAWLRLDDDAEDATLDALAIAARRHVEDLTGRAVGAGRFRLALPAWPAAPVAVALTPLTGIDAVALVAVDGTRTALSPSLVRLDAVEPDRLVLSPAPAGSDGRTVEVTLVAGEAAPPAPLVQAVRMLAAHWFENRGDAPAADLPGAVLALLAPYRRPRL